jgi:hypothetical protein
MRREDQGLLGIALALATTLGLAGCGTMGKHIESTPPVAAPDRPNPDLESVTETLRMMEALPEGDPANEAELFEAARNAASLQPTTGNKLRYALALATPGHAGSDPVAAQRQLSELLATPETLLPAERLLAIVELKDVDQRLILQAENKQLRDEAPRETRDKVQVINRRLAAEADENVRLHKALEEAQAKLEAVTHIERSINDRGTNGSHP